MAVQTKTRVSLLGSTGSIGTSTLSVIRQHRENFEIVSLSCGSSLDVLREQIEEFSPQFVSLGSEELAIAAKSLLPKSLGVKIFSGPEGHRDCIRESRPDVVISAMMGTYGLEASLQAVHQGVRTLGIANKEILVMAGPFILKALKNSATALVPVDSEHSAIFQALMGNSLSDVKKMILTASGGPFRTRPLETFEEITKAEALRHPNWAMGAKITVDSATMMNKGLEYIEAVRLFGIDAQKVQVVVHPESIVHSLVEYCDGSFMAQLGISDMRIPISLALAYPKRLSLKLDRQLDLVELGTLRFEAPDYERFSCLKLAIQAEAQGAEGPIVLNAANEIAVERFLKEEIGFCDIARLVEASLAQFTGARVSSLQEVTELDQEVKNWALADSSHKTFSSGRRDLRLREKLTL